MVAGTRGHSRTAALITLMALTLSGCANQNAVYRNRMIGQNRPVVLTMDAKQRNVVMLPETAGGGDRGAAGDAASVGWRVCAEASPDVFSALSTSAGADLGFGQSGAQTEARAKAAIAIAEAAGTIERTQTINLLRESMYRTCERYLSGAIGRTTFVVQAGRDWRAMIAVLAIEQLTRSARPPSTVLVAGSTSASVSGSADVVKELVGAKAEQRAAEDAAAKIAGEAAADCTKVDAAAKEACEAAKVAGGAAKPAADLRVARAKEDVEDYRAALKLGPAADHAGAATGGGVPLPGGSAPAPSASDLATVARVVQTIATKALETDELQLFCIQKLAGEELTENSALGQRCLALLSVAVGARTDTLSQELAAFNSAADDRQAVLRRYLVDDAGATAKWPALLQQSGLADANQALAQRLLAAPITVETVTDRFRRLVPEDFRIRIAALLGGN